MDSEDLAATAPDQDGIAAALGAIPSGLFVVTVGRLASPRTDGSSMEEGPEPTGFLASFVQQVGFEPPALVVAVRSERIAAAVRSVGGFGVHVLGKEDRDHLVRFAKGPPSDGPAFDGLAHAPGPCLGVPLLPGTVAQLECRLVGEAARWSDHVVFCGHVLAGRRTDPTDKSSAVHLRRNGLSY